MTESAEKQAGEIADLMVEIYNIHEIVIAETGGLSGLRDRGLLHAAAARPFATFDGEELYPSDLEKAAALFHSLIKNHPFLDGTKRTAFLSTLFFLETRGIVIPVHLPKDWIVEFCVSVAEENLRIGMGEEVRVRTIAEIAKWFFDLLIAQSPES